MPDGISGQSRYSDDEIERGLRKLTGDQAAESRIHEASAAERAKQARKQAKQQARKARGHGKLISSLVVVVVLALVGGLVWLRFGRPTSAVGRSASGTATPTAVASPTASIAAAPGITAPGISLNITSPGPPADPFADSPAAGWANGVAGIVVPAARPVGGFTAAEVAAAYQTTKKLLVTSGLNKHILLGGAPTAFADLLTSRDRTRFLAGLTIKSPVRNTRLDVTSFAPGSTKLIGGVIKVRGSMSARSVTVSGTVALAVVINYIFDYAIEPPGTPADWMRLTTHQAGRFDFAQWDGSVGLLTPWDQATISTAGIICGETDGYIHPSYPTLESTGATPSPSGSAIDPYSFATSGPGGTCNPLTRNP
jgi:hypothetical protein